MTKARTLLIAFVAALCVVAGLGAAAATGGSRADKRPNILVIMTDDEGAPDVRFTPNVQHLIADKGATFDNSFVSLSLCCPSRATFLTGQYAHNHHVLSNGENGGGYYALDNTNTLAVWLQKSGYFTALIGKYLNKYGSRNPREVPPGWNEWHGLLTPYRYSDYAFNENGTVVTHERTYQTDDSTEEALRVLHSHASSDRPFFMWLTYVAPHETGRAGGGRASGGEEGRSPPIPAARDLGKFSNVPLPRPPSFNEADVSDKPEAIRKLPLLTESDIAQITASFHARGESLLAVDDGVQKIFDALSAEGVLDNTIVVFTSDNGWMQGEHRVANGKVLPYEPSIRVPLMIRGPGIPAGIHLPQPVINADLAPTIVALAHAVPGRTMDGRSLLPFVKDPKLWSGRDLLLEGPGADVASLDFHGIRTPRYVYVEYATGEREMYDLVKDPYELQNVAAAPAYQKMRAELAARLQKLRSCAGVSCRVQPALELDVKCSGKLTDVGLTGADAGRLVSADFSVGGRRAALDGRPPFRVLTRLQGAVRVLATLDDGTRMTLLRAAPRCSS